MSRSLAIAALGALGALGAAACASTAAAPDAPASAWTLGPPMPRRALDPGVTALGQELVVAGGFDVSPAGTPDISAEVDALDTVPLGSSPAMWGRLPDAPVRWTDLNLAAIGATLYLAGGLEGPGGAAHGDTFALDPVDHTWHALAAMPPGEERGASGVVTAPGKIYLLGGASSAAAVATCLVYDTLTGTWNPQLLPPLPAPRAHPAAMRRSDGTLIVAGGFASADTSAPRGEAWALPPLGKAWIPVAPMFSPGDPAARGGCAYGVVLGQLVCAGGASGPAGSRVVQSYDPYNDVWTVVEPMPVARTGTPGAAIGGRLYVPGGADAPASAPTDTLYIYTPLSAAAR